MVSILLVISLVASPIWPLGANPSHGDPFLIVNSATNELAWIEGGDIQEILSVATGKATDQTPIGEFTVVVKAKDPYYRKLDIKGGDPNNPLGTRWIGFDALDTDGRIYGIHGTNRPELIGNHVTGGCIRLPNETVEWLYDQVPLGTKIYIVGEDGRSFEEIAKEAGAM
ncbi:L,D-transpeptidase [Bacillus sp. FJAT-45037]|uniref:L,D-transpeptidase n=1 Tax=Bacillus sp. FJAT-45037 TaxID=2011007 RepID=UPI000C24CCCF|nr:L,D-transpeptidase [Bacillus sp. FJAT-45037]